MTRTWTRTSGTGNSEPRAEHWQTILLLRSRYYGQGAFLNPLPVASGQVALPVVRFVGVRTMGTQNQTTTDQTEMMRSRISGGGSAARVQRQKNAPQTSGMTEAEFIEFGRPQSPANVLRSKILGKNTKKKN